MPQTNRCRCCGEDVRLGLLACRKHWFQLPSPLRDAINDTWRGRADPANLRAYVEHVREAERLWAQLNPRQEKLDV